MTTSLRLPPENMDCLANLRINRYDWNIKVQVIRKWQNVSKSGGLVKGFNLLLLDDKNVTMQAFVAGVSYDKYKDFVHDGSIYIISNFSVKDVPNDSTYLLTTKERSISFTSYTSVEESEDHENLIPDNSFDLYDIADTQQLLRQRKFLSDFIGVIEDYQPIRRWRSKTDNEIQKAIIKFVLTDTSGSIRVVLWDTYAEKFHELMNAAEEEPYIAIIAVAIVVKSEDALEIATANATSFYINSEHHSVHQLRKMILNNPQFTATQQSQRRSISYPFYSIEHIVQRGMDNIGCTSCREELSTCQPSYKCDLCSRDVLYADRKFQVGTICSDDTGIISLVMTDTDIRRLTGKTVFHLTRSVCKGNEEFNYPEELKNLINMDIRALVELTKEHVLEGCNVFHASEVIMGHSDSELGQPTQSNQTMVSQLYSNYGEMSTSGTDYHLDTISDMEQLTPLSKKNIATKKRTKKAVPNK